MKTVRFFITLTLCWLISTTAKSQDTIIYLSQSNVVDTIFCKVSKVTSAAVTYAVKQQNTSTGYSADRNISRDKVIYCNTIIRPAIAANQKPAKDSTVI